MNGRFSAALLAGCGLALGVLAMVSSERTSSASSTLVRARLPQLAADSAAPPATPAMTATATAMPASTPAGMAICTVTHIVDGDTIDVAGCAEPGRVRLILVNTPEINPGECFGKQAAGYTNEALLNHQVALEKDVSNKDSFGRNLRYVWLDGALFNERLVRDGYAELAVYPPDVKYRARIEAAQQEAKAEKRGLWPVCGMVGVPGTATPVQSPTATATPSPTPQGTATPTPTVGSLCQAATATITGLDKFGEVVTVSGSGNMTGWYVISVKGQQRFDFPGNFTLNGSVQIRSGTPAFPNTPATLWWTAASQWSNSDNDDAVLYNCTGQQVSYFDDGM